MVLRHVPDDQHSRGISAKQLEREIGVAYKTAHRMMKLIRTELMHDLDAEPLRGDVEIDETSFTDAGRRRAYRLRPSPGLGPSPSRRAWAQGSLSARP